MVGLIAVGLTACSSKSPVAQRRGPWIGLIQAPASQAAQWAKEGADEVVLGLSWDVFEPQPDRYANGYIRGIAKEIDRFHQAGIAVTLDLGLQYPPSWVFSLPGGTRLVNQYGETWHGDVGSDPPNLVFDPAVRDAASDYIDTVAARLGAHTFAAIRIGGLLSGELRYPPNIGGGHSNDIWMYDSDARADAPDPNWRPGTGTPSQAAAELQFYLSSLTSYEQWLLRTVASEFTGQLEVLFPSWGIRPGQIAAAVADRLDGRSAGEQNGAIASGLDWSSQVEVMTAFPRRAVVYTTWLDAPNFGSTPTQVDPADYLAGLAGLAGLPMAGENTGGGTSADLTLSLGRVARLHLEGMMWFSAPQLLAGTRLDLSTWSRLVLQAASGA